MHTRVPGVYRTLLLTVSSSEITPPHVCDCAKVINMDCSLHRTHLATSDLVFLMLAREVFSQPGDTYLLCSAVREVSETWAVTGGVWQGTASSRSIFLPCLSAMPRKGLKWWFVHTPLIQRKRVVLWEVRDRKDTGTIGRENGQSGLNDTWMRRKSRFGWGQGKRSGA